MGGDYDSWIYQKSLLEPPNLNCASLPSDPRWQDRTFPMKFSFHVNPYAWTDSESRIMPGFPVSQFPQAWHISCTHETCPLTIPESKFETGNNMSLISAGYPLQVPSSTNVRTFDCSGGCVESIINAEPVISESIKRSTWCRLNENYETDVQGSHLNGMHEDTEELDALLCTDDEDEETSTGHSPSDMTQYQRKEVKDNAKITKAVTPNKRRRLDRVHDPSLMDTASSGKAWKYEGDAESSSIKVSGPSIVNKPMRNKRIREKMGILRTMIPGGKGKNAAVVLDETIRCLKSLKLKAKALGATATEHR
ncbi:hypothetical protein AAC387_Pa04g2836 [Persea americana]